MARIDTSTLIITPEKFYSFSIIATFLLYYMEDRRKQKWQRYKKNNKAELNCLGIEPVQMANSRNGKKVSETEILLLCSQARYD